jgi:hypothetical protein
MDGMSSAVLPVPAAPGRLVSAAAARRLRHGHETALRLRTIAALGPNASFHRGRASVHADVLDALSGPPLTYGRCREISDALLTEAGALHGRLAQAPPRVRTPTEIHEAARLEELLAAALLLSAAGRAAHPRPLIEYAARLRLLLTEGGQDAGAMLAEAWDDTLWG